MIGVERRTNCWLGFIVTASIGAMIAFSSGIARSASVRTVALSGEQAPGTPAGVYYDWFTTLPSLNVAGQTAFIANVVGSGVNNDNNMGVWSESAGALGLVARSGGQAPGAPTGINFETFRVGESPIAPPRLNAAGQTAFRASLTNVGNGIWSEGSGGLALVALTGNPAPGPPDSSDFRGLFEPVLNDIGRTAFAAISERNGIWAETMGGLSLAALSGQPAPGTPDGVNYVNHSSPALNNSGQVAFFYGLSGGSPIGSNNGMWSGEPGSIRLVARSGLQAPGTESGVVFNNVMVNPGFNEPALNHAGQVAFRASLRGISGSITNNFGIWSEGSGTLSLVARTGDHAPGTSDGVNFNLGLFPVPLPPPIVNDGGQTVFIAGLTGTGVEAANDSGIWLDTQGELDLIVREDDPAPGTNAASFVGFASFALNAAGQIAFLSGVTGDGVNTANDRGIWATDLEGEPQLIAREGELLEVAPGDSRTISFLDFIAGSGNGDGRASGFNNRGQLAFMATFTDGSSGIFVSNVVAVPEPHSLMLLSMAMFLSARPCHEPADP